MYSLTAQPRTVLGNKLPASRKEGQLPAVIYGPHRKESKSLFVDSKVFLGVWKKAGESSLIDLDIEGEKSTKVLVHQIAFHPVKDTPIHVDFYEMDLKKPVTLHVPIHFEGESAAENVLGGVLLKQLHEVEISSLPDRIPHSLSVDISALATFDERINLGDIVLPEGVTLIGNLETVVALVDPPRTEAEVTAMNAETEGEVDFDAIKREGDDKPVDEEEGDSPEETA